MISSHTKTLQNNIKLNKTVELTAVSKKYPLMKTADKNVSSGFEDFWALKDISLDAYQGQVLGIIGRNGAGKTTLLNIIADVLSPTQGETLVKGRVLGLFNLGVGFQDELTGRENVFLNGAIIGATRRELENKLSSIIDFSELGYFIDMPLGAYSQGMRLRLAFSIIANLDFDILVIDEVLAVGDALFQNKCFQRLMDFRRQGKTLIITTQSMDLIGRLCDTVALLDHGHLLFSGHPEEVINRYRLLLNTETFFVGPAQKEVQLFTETKKWADDISGWGRKLGTKEAVIDCVEFINKFGFRCNSVKTGDPLKVRVHFTVKNNIKEPHFGVAIFRNDGVYCYGPNTAFDGHKIPELKPGKAQFELYFKKILLAAGEYRISVAIWDKNETLAFDYHEGCYKLTITGNHNSGNELLNMTFRFSPRSYKNFEKASIDFSILSDKWGQKIETELVKIESVKLLNNLGEEKGIFMTNESVKLVINFSNFINCDKNYLFWVGLYRDDGIYCHGLIRLVGRKKVFEIFFPKLPLLPGGYRFSIGIWSALKKEFLIYSHGIHLLKMVFDKKDHGTVYLEHEWNYSC